MSDSLRPVPGAGFPTTHGSALRGARTGDAEERTRSFGLNVAASWTPAAKYSRATFRRTNEDGKDRTQGFFTRAMEKEFFAAYDPARGRFRAYLRTCLEGYLANEHKAARRQKRGGDAVLL